MAHVEQLTPLIAGCCRRPAYGSPISTRSSSAWDPGRSPACGSASSPPRSWPRWPGRPARRLQPGRAGRPVRGRPAHRRVRGGHRCPAARGLLGPLRPARHPASAGPAVDRPDAVPRLPDGRARPSTSTPTGSRRDRTAEPRSWRAGRRRAGPARCRTGAALPAPARTRPNPAGRKSVLHYRGAAGDEPVDPRIPMVSILPARRGDLDAIMALERAGFADRRAVERAQLAGRAAGGQPHGPDRPGRHPVGVITFSVIGELADLHRLVVAPAHRRPGIGAELVEAGLRGGPPGRRPGRDAGGRLRQRTGHRALPAARLRAAARRARTTTGRAGTP